MAILLALAAAIAVQGPVSQPDWRPLGRHPDGIDLAYDRASVRLDSSQLLARVEFRASHAGRYAVSLVEIRCASNEARVVRTQNYTADGTPTQLDDRPVPWRSIVPESNFAVIKREVCPTVV